jgi:hypothetical protein
VRAGERVVSKDVLGLWAVLALEYYPIHALVADVVR